MTDRLDALADLKRVYFDTMQSLDDDLRQWGIKEYRLRKKMIKLGARITSGKAHLRSLAGKVEETVRLFDYLIEHPHVSYTLDDNGLPIITNDEDKVHYLLSEGGQTS